MVLHTHVNTICILQQQAFVVKFIVCFFFQMLIHVAHFKGRVVFHYRSTQQLSGLCGGPLAVFLSCHWNQCGSEQPRSCPIVNKGRQLCLESMPSSIYSMFIIPFGPHNLSYTYRTTILISQMRNLRL